MATFMTDLWNSIFTPGPTPTLLIATNVTFAALQLLLLSLLAATQSIHFGILSVLCGGLWWSINWFVGELRAAQQKEEEAIRIRGARKSREKDSSGLGATGSGPQEGAQGGGGEGMDSGDDTETEIDEKTGQGQGISTRGTGKKENVPHGGAGLHVPGTGLGTSSTGAQTRLAPPGDNSFKNRKGMAESDASLSTVSTDSEWEKVE